MNYNETRSYIERHLVKLGWQVRLDKAGYKKIYQYTGGHEDRLGQLYYKLVSVGSMQSKREITDGTVNAAIEDLKRMDEIVDKAKVNSAAIPQNRTELDRFSIDQLAKTLETEVALEEKQARIEEEKFPKVEPIKKAAPESGSLPRILVVDDSPTIRAAVTKALSNDFSFVQAPDGEQAWKILMDDKSIQLVITDLMMPKLDGYELIKRVRTDRTSARISQIPIIVVTTLEDTNAKLRALVAGANDFVTKSTDAAELKMRVMARYKVAQSAKAIEQASQSVNPAAAARSTQGAATATTKTASDKANTAQTQASTAAASTPSATQKTASTVTPPHKGAASAAPKTSPSHSTPARPSQTAGAARSGSSTGTTQDRASADAGARSQDSLSIRPGIRNPINPASVISPFSSSMGQFSETINRVREWFAKLNPLTATTVGATVLVFVAIVAIIMVNRPSRTVPTPVAEVPGTETVADAAIAGNATPVSSTTVSTKNAETARTSAPQSTRVADSQKTASTGKIKDRTTAEAKSEQPSSEVSEPAPAKKPPIEQTAKVPLAAQTPAVVPSEGKETAPKGEALKPEQATKDDSKIPPVAMIDGKSGTAAVVSVITPAVSNSISQAELTSLIKRFEFVYEAGDIDQFLVLFDENVRTNDRFSKAGLREDYEELFKSTEFRVMALKNVTWELHDTRADGWGNFEVKVRKTGEQGVKEYKGSLTFNVEKIDGRIRIKRLYHGQWRAS